MQAFEKGYEFFPWITGAKSYDLSQTLRKWVIARHQLSDPGGMGAAQILLRFTQDDGLAFDLFFEALDAVLSSGLDALNVFEARFLAGDPLPASGYLDVLTERPGMFLPTISVGCLRAFLDGYSLAAAEEGHFECLDLEGFEHWVRRHFSLKGMFRWEDAILAQFSGDEATAFEWAVRELKAYRTSKGPLSERRYWSVRVTDI